MWCIFIYLFYAIQLYTNEYANGECIMIDILLVSYLVS